MRCERLIMRALQFAIATANLASQIALLFLATRGPIFIASSSAATLLQCGFQYCQCLRRELLPHCGIPPLVVSIGTREVYTKLLA
jgi:hypothetical protein